MNERTIKRDKLKKNIQIEWKELKTRKNKKTIIKYTKKVKNWKTRALKQQKNMN